MGIYSWHFIFNFQNKSRKNVTTEQSHSMTGAEPPQPPLIPAWYARELVISPGARLSSQAVGIRSGGKQ